MNLKRFNLGAILVAFGIILLSVPEFLLEAKHGIENYGYLGGVLIFIFYAHKAYKRHLFHERDKRWEAKFDAIAKAVGAECGPQRISRKGDLPNLGRFFLLSRKAINRVSQLRRKRKMNKGTLVTVIAFLIAKAQQYFGIAELPPGTAELAADAIIGAFIVWQGIALVYARLRDAWKSRDTMLPEPQVNTLTTGGDSHGDSQFAVADQPTK